MSREQSLAMLKEGEVPERYLRNIGTIGIEGQIRLLQARVLVVGAGGLGGTVIELLARQGVGHIKVVDGDCFAWHNLNRQILATELNIGSSKASEAVRRLGAVNSDVIVEPVLEMLRTENASQLLDGFDVAVDALDNISSRLILSRQAQTKGIPLVHGAIAGFTGQVMTVLPSSKGLEAVYGSACADKGIEKATGNPAPTPALVAALQAQEVIKIITGKGKVLANRLLHVDTEFNCFEMIDLG